GVDLCLDDHHAAELRGDLLRFLGRVRHTARGHRHTVRAQNVARLILMNVHVIPECRKHDLGRVGRTRPKLIQGTIAVPDSPCTALSPWSRRAMIARCPPLRMNSMAASTFGPMLPSPNSPASSIRPASATRN